jgi:hypothetical protein
MSFGCWIVWEKMGFSSKSRFKCFCEISDFGENGLSWFGMGKHDFTLECDRFKWLERVGETKSKTDQRSEFYVWNGENWKSENLVLSGTQDRAPYRHGPCMWLNIELHDHAPYRHDRAPCAAVRKLDFSPFRGPLRIHISFKHLTLPYWSVIRLLQVFKHDLTFKLFWFWIMG